MKDISLYLQTYNFERRSLLKYQYVKVQKMTVPSTEFHNHAYHTSTRLVHCSFDSKNLQNHVSIVIHVITNSCANI